MVDNKDVNYTLYIADDVAHYIHPEQLPENIQVIRGIPQFSK